MSNSKPASKKPGKTTLTEAEEEENNVEIISGISSAHSWIKALTFVKPKNLGRDEEDSDEEEEEVHISLSSKNPNQTSKQIKWSVRSGSGPQYFIKTFCRWNHKKGRYVKLVFVEKMIEHLSIDGYILEVRR